MRIRIVLVAAAFALLVAGVAWASIPDAQGVIHGCRKNSTGDLRVIDSASQQCAGNETALNWNQTGPQGPAGPQGEQGPAGPGGLGVPHVVELAFFNSPPGLPRDVRCLTGEVALGLAVTADKTYNATFIVEDDRPVGVRYAANSDSNNLVQVTCAPVA